MRTVDSRELTKAFGRRHHNLLAAIDLVLRQCPAAAVHINLGIIPSLPAWAEHDTFDML